ncbi:MAG: cupin domain-containing protein [Nocardioidaceae bacterium]
MMVRSFADLDFKVLPGRLSADPFAGSDSAGTSARVVRIEPGGPRSAHRHPRSAEVVYVAEGAGRAWQEGEAQRVSGGDMVFVPRGVPHATVPDPDSALLLVCFFPDPDLVTNLEELDTVIDLGAV